MSEAEDDAGVVVCVWVGGVALADTHTHTHAAVTHTQGSNRYNSTHTLPLLYVAPKAVSQSYMSTSTLLSLPSLIVCVSVRKEREEKRAPLRKLKGSRRLFATKGEVIKLSQSTSPSLPVTASDGRPSLCHNRRRTFL